MKRNFHFNWLGSIASFLILLAPAMVQQAGCAFLWGEADCPDCLKES